MSHTNVPFISLTQMGEVYRISNGVEHEKTFSIAVALSRVECFKERPGKMK